MHMGARGPDQCRRPRALIRRMAYSRRGFQYGTRPPAAHARATAPATVTICQMRLTYCVPVGRKRHRHASHPCRRPRGAPCCVPPLDKVRQAGPQELASLFVNSDHASPASRNATELAKGGGAITGIPSSEDSRLTEAQVLRFDCGCGPDSPHPHFSYRKAVPFPRPLLTANRPVPPFSRAVASGQRNRNRLNRHLS